MADVYCLNLDKMKAPRRRRMNTGGIPFQKFYLVPPDMGISACRRLAPYALLLPLVEEYRQVLSDNNLEFDDLLTKSYRVLVPTRMTEDRTNVKEATWKKSSREDITLKISYLATPAWSHYENLVRPFFPEDTKLLTPQSIYDPVCMSCTRHLEHLSGECTIGTTMCKMSIRVPATPMIETEAPQDLPPVALAPPAESES